MNMQVGRIRMRGTTGSLVLACAGLLAACDGGGDPSGVDGPVAVEIGAPSTYVELGQKVLLTAAVKDASGQTVRNARVTWASSDPAVAVVEDGLVTGRYPGSIFVRASAGAVADSVRVTVEGPPVGEIVASPGALHLIRGRAAQLFVQVRDPAGKPMAHPLLFSSSAPEVASVTGTGEVQATAPGTAVVTVAAGLKSVQVQLSVVNGDRYSVVPLETLGGPADPNLARSVAYDLNNRGDIVGEALSPAGIPQAVLWRGGKVTVLAPPPAGSGGSGARAVNDEGTVVGHTLVNPNGTVYRARPWLWRNGLISPLAGLDTLSYHGVAIADLDNQGRVVGNTYGTYFKDMAGSGFIWRDGQVTWLPRLDLLTAPAAINDRGTIAVNGLYACVMCGPESPPASRAFTGEHPQFTPILLPDTAGMLWNASGINERGQVVGTFWRRDGTGSRSAFLWEGGSFTLIPALPGAASINRYGDVVGGRFLYRSGRAIDLDQAVASPEWEILSTSRINDLGQIAAQARRRGSGAIEAVLLSPAQ